MKKNYFLLLLFLTTIGFAQIPSGYYSTATGTGYTLKTQLYNIIKGHTDNGYAGLYTTYQTSDVDNFYENDGTILDMYSENPSGTDPYTYTTGTTQRCGNYSVEGDCYNREHIIPQSVFNEQSPMVADAHFITPTDGKVNGMRSNYPHGNVSSATYTSQNGSKLGSSAVSGYSGTVFEPINEFKGDIARMYFYFATRYENTVAGYSYAMFNGSSNQVFTTAFLNMLLAWHTQDPVNAREIARNNAIYTRQNNRNPFIDHPEYVNQIWGGTSSGDTQAPTAPTSLASTAKTATSITLSWTASTDNVAVTGYDIYANSVLKTTVTGLTGTITGLTASTSYSIYVKAKDAAGNASASSNTISVTTDSSGTGTATDLLFSEYIEGSGNNKALEIANNTGTSINLSAYTIKKQTNGAGSWSTGLALSGTLTTGSKFVIVNS
ncbi:endonuclease [Flavobacterium ginsenosidimutans]|uniref:endonuclease n=1 Tax=Flavobacterium ginsenosidimutans TaxID=687844 RepID=UPI003D98CE90